MAFFEIVQTQNYTAKNVPQRQVCFKEFKVKLTRPVSGKTNLVLRFSKTGCCNFAGWRFL